MGSPCYFLSFRGQRIEQKETVFVYILGFIFYGFSRAKTDLHNKYMI